MIVKTMVAECDHPPCLVVYEFHDPYGHEAHQAYTTLTRAGWATENIHPWEKQPDGAILTFCPNHNTKEKRA